jgi:hypothetical protein
MEAQIFHHAKKKKKKKPNLKKNHLKRNQNPSRYYYNSITNLQKNNPLKRNQNPSRYYDNSIITNLKFQHKPKISSFKNPHIKNRLVTHGPKSLKLLLLYTLKKTLEIKCLVQLLNSTTKCVCVCVCVCFCCTSDMK